MQHIGFGRFLPILFLAIATAATASAAPLVSNVRASQRTDGSGMVDIYYNLSGGSGSMIVDVAISNNDGASYGIIPVPRLLSGAVGTGVTNGTNKHIVWDAARDKAEVYWPNARVRVRASDTGETITLQLPGGVPLEMVRIPPGVFTMGSGLDPGWSNDSEAPPHTVTINYEFYMGKFEVTQAQWYAVMGTNPSYFTGVVDRPVEQVSWNMCQEFITALNGLGIGTYRLPSEAEWEYACRAGSTTRWHFGNDETQLSAYAWFNNNDGSNTKPVGQKLPNAFGLFDMHGNVWEWVQDWWHNNYVGAPNNGSAWEDPVGQYRVLRGGAFLNLANNCRSAARSSFTPGLRGSDLGLRLVRTP